MKNKQINVKNKIYDYFYSESAKKESNLLVINSIFWTIFFLSIFYFIIFAYDYLNIIFNKGYAILFGVISIILFLLIKYFFKIINYYVLILLNIIFLISSAILGGGLFSLFFQTSIEPAYFISLISINIIFLLIVFIFNKIFKKDIDNLDVFLKIAIISLLTDSFFLIFLFGFSFSLIFIFLIFGEIGLIFLGFLKTIQDLRNESEIGFGDKRISLKYSIIFLFYSFLLYLTLFFKNN